jgi:hypothetical protein
MSSLVIVAILLVAGAPLVVHAQTSTRANPAASPETSSAPALPDIAQRRSGYPGLVAGAPLAKLPHVSVKPDSLAQQPMCERCDQRLAPAL